jgi:hypothetical protein
MNQSRRWLAAHSCDHAHCPEGCEKPQPRMIDGGRLVCGRCLVIEGRISEMIPCVPEICD